MNTLEAMTYYRHTLKLTMRWPLTSQGSLWLCSNCEASAYHLENLKHNALCAFAAAEQVYEQLMSGTHAVNRTE